MIPAFVNSGSNRVNTIVVVKLRAIGDAIIATPAIRALRQAYPSATIVVVTTPVAAPIFHHHPCVDRVWVYSKTFPTNLWAAWRVLTQIRELKPDLVINFHASSHSAWLSRLMGAPALVVHNHSGKNLFSTIPITAPKEAKSAIERDLDAVRALGLEPQSVEPDVCVDPRDAIAAQAFFDRYGMDPERQIIVAINPGASRLTKRWPLERFAATARTLLEDPTARVVVIGGPGEEILAKRLQAQVGDRVVTATGFTLLQTAAVLMRCRVFIGNDAGTHHLAAALKVPSVTVFGPELPQEWHPYALPRHEAVTRQVHCVNCGLSFCDRMECMSLISVEDVVDAVRRVLTDPSLTKPAGAVLINPHH